MECIKGSDCSRLLDCNPETKEWLDFNFQAGQYFEGVTGGDILSTFVDKIDRDGNGQKVHHIIILCYPCI